VEIVRDFSVIIPTFNRLGYLKQAIESCFIGNETLDIEVIVVDDGSTDGSVQYLKSLESNMVSCYFQQRKGPQFARNLGKSKANGRYIKFLDDDDYLEPGALQKEFLFSKEDADLILSECVFVNPNGTVIGIKYHYSSKNIFYGLFQEGSYLPVQVSYKRSFISDLNWDNNLGCRQDFHFLTEVILRKPKTVFSTFIAGTIRQHSGERVSSLNNVKSRCSINHLIILRSAFERLKEEVFFDKYLKDVALLGLYKWAYLIAVSDFKLFKTTVKRIESYDSKFFTTKKFNIIIRLFGVVSYVKIVNLPRRIKYFISNWNIIYMLNGK